MKTRCTAPYLDLIRAPYLLYGVKYIDLVSLAAPLPAPLYFFYFLFPISPFELSDEDEMYGAFVPLTLIVRPTVIFCMVLNI